MIVLFDSCIPAFNDKIEEGRVNAAMGFEDNETFSNGSSEPHMRRVNESPSVCTCTVLSERDLWHQPCVPEREGSGDDEEYRDEVLAVSITPEH